jgi:phasin family protein
MNKTRFQLPPRTESTVGVDRWVTTVEESRPAAAAMSHASGKPTEALASIKFPVMFDMMALLAAHRRNIDAIIAANRILWEAAQAVARRNHETMQQAIDGLAERMQVMGNPECPRDRAVRQTELAIKAYEDATATVRATAGMIQHANTAAMDVLTMRFTEAADEAKSLARYATSVFWDTDAKPAPVRHQI